MRRALISLLMVLAACNQALPDAPPEQTGVSDRRYATAIAASRALLLKRAQVLPGVAVAVAVDDQLVWTSGFGWADLNAKRAMKPDTRARVYSVAKPMTAALAMRLSEQGAIDLESPVAQYVGSLPAPISRVTLNQILSHRSGIRHYRDGEWLEVSRQPCASPDRALFPFISDPLETPPSYSSFAYVLASEVLQAAAGRPFHDALRGEVLDRAGMTSTVADTAANELGLTFYEPARFGRVRVARTVDNSCKFGAGGLLSTAPDLASFGAALLAGRIVGAGSLQRMTQATGNFANGFGVAQDDRLGPLAVQSGAAIGGMSYLLLAPRQRVVVAIVSNMEGDRFREEAMAIARAFAAARAVSAM